jgi:hypothetical protein
MSASLLALACWLAGDAATGQQARTPPLRVPQRMPASDPLPLPPPQPQRHDLYQTTLQQAQPEQRSASDTLAEYKIPLEPPGPERLFRMESEAALFERMRQEARERKAPERIVFPESPVLAKEPYYGRSWPATRLEVEPHYVCHGRLLFEEVNSERYGWELGLFQPVISTLYFYKDVATLPYKLGSRLCDRFDCSAGKCLPGDPVPYLIYPPGLSLTGALTEGAVIAGLIAIFP